MSLLKSLLTGSPRASGDNESSFARSPSFNEMSFGAGEEHEAYEAAKNDPKFMESAEVNDPSSIKPRSFGSSSSGGGVWQSTFNPGRNFHENMKKQGAQYFDHIEGDKGHHPTIWDHVLHSDRHRNFDQLDTDKDGFLTAEDLQTALGRTQDVKQLIAAADTNNDGRIDRNEFQELLKNSTIAR